MAKHVLAKTVKLAMLYFSAPMRFQPSRYLSSQKYKGWTNIVANKFFFSYIYQAKIWKAVACENWHLSLMGLYILVIAKLPWYKLHHDIKMTSFLWDSIMEQFHFWYISNLFLYRSGIILVWAIQGTMQEMLMQMFLGNNSFYWGNNFLS